MSMYTFFFRRDAASTPVFEAHEFESDSAAIAAAGRLLGQHPTCNEVQVLDAEREVHTCARPPRPPQPDGGLDKVERVLDAINPGAAVIVTDREGSVLLWNRGATRLYGWGPAEALGSSIVDMTPAVQSRKRARAIMSELQAGKMWEGEIVLRRRDGTPFRAFVADVPLVEDNDGGGMIIGISAPADSRAAVWEAQSKILNALQGDDTA